MKRPTETRTIDGIEYKVLLRRVPEKNTPIAKKEESNVRNRKAYDNHEPVKKTSSKSNKKVTSTKKIERK
jgi:hypothetical protein